MSVNLVVTEPKGESDVPEFAIREQLLRMLESPIFVNSHRLSRFLRFTVETTLAGQVETLKEYLIGTEVLIASHPTIRVWTPLFAARREGSAIN